MSAEGTRNRYIWPTFIQPHRYLPTARSQTLASIKESVSNLAIVATQLHNVIKEIPLEEEYADAGDYLRTNGGKNSIDSDKQAVPVVDDTSQTEGADAFHKFERQVKNLDKQLHLFSNAARKIGGSVNILRSVRRLRDRLDGLLDLFRCNAAELFPLVKTSREPSHQLLRDLLVGHGQNICEKLQKPADSGTGLGPEQLPKQFESLANDVGVLLKYLNEFPDFANGSVDATPIKYFESDLRYWADCLKEHEGKFENLAIRHYLHDFTTEAGGLGEHMDTIAKTILHFTDIGIPSIHLSQQHGATTLQNLSTVATFFSAVTATTIQFSYDNTDSSSARAVNAFWFASLVFSIASVVNSLLGLTWKQATYRSTAHKTPWWVLMWIERSPLVFLVIAIAFFAVGLVLFTYTSNQGYVTCLITVVFTSFSSFGLIAVSAWFASERWMLSKRQPQSLVVSVINALKFRWTFNWPLVQWVLKTYDTMMDSNEKQLAALKSILTQKTEWLFGNTTPSTPTMEPMPRLESTQPSPDSPSSSNTPPISKKTITLRQVAMCVLTLRRLPRSSTPNGTNSSELRNPMTNTSTKSRVRLNAVTSDELKEAKITRVWSPHQASVKHLQFSPDSKYLVMLSQDKTWAIFKVGDPHSDSGPWTTVARILDDPIDQVSWSSDGNLLISKHDRIIKIWTKEGRIQKSFYRGRSVQSVTWMPKGEAFLSVETYPEGSEVVKMDSSGKPIVKYDFHRINLRSVTVTPELHRIVGVGVLIKSTEGRSPEKSKQEKRIIIYDTDKGKIVSQMPLFSSVCDVAVECNSESKRIALVSYKSKSTPQLWKLGSVKDNDGKKEKEMSLSLIHTYLPKVPVDFAGPSYFGGKDNQLVLCATKKGDIYIWDRECGTLLRHILPQRSDGDSLTCISCNRAQDGPFIFATGSQDGSVRIWTVPKPTRSISQDIDIPSNNSLPPHAIAEPSVSSSKRTLHQAQEDPPLSFTTIAELPRPIFRNVRTESPIDQTQHFSSPDVSSNDDAVTNRSRQATSPMVSPEEH